MAKNVDNELFLFSVLDKFDDNEESDRQLINERPENPDEPKVSGKKFVKCVCEICERVFSRKDSLLQVILFAPSTGNAILTLVQVARTPSERGPPKWAFDSLKYANLC